MKTDDLIEGLVADLTPARPGAVAGRIALTVAAGAAAALALVLAWLGLRPDLADAMDGGMFWMKASYAAVLAAAGFWAVERLARPAASPRGGLGVALVAVAVMTAVAAARIMLTPPTDRMSDWLGQSWRACPVLILLLSIPTLAVVLLALRRLAPTRLRLAGAAAGLLAGGVAATAYGLHCTEATAAFLATWYTLGVVLSAGLGALLGPWALRWR